MRTKSISLAAILAILLPLTVVSLFAQESTPDWTLALLRGRWMAHTYTDAWIINILDDSTLLYDDTLMTYSLEPGFILLRSDAGSEELHYRLSDNLLTLVFEDGRSRTFERKSGGSAESNIEGKYFCLTLPKGEVVSDRAFSTLRFDGRHTFTASIISPTEWTDSSTLSEFSGVYRVAGPNIIMVSDDGMVEQASLFRWDGDDTPHRIFFRGHVFENGDDYTLPVVLPPTADNGPIIIIDPYIPPPIPDPAPSPTPMPPGHPTEPDNGSTTTTHPQTQAPRPIGSSREDLRPSVPISAPTVQPAPPAAPRPIGSSREDNKPATPPPPEKRDTPGGRIR
jgi:hypothetical protein